MTPPTALKSRKVKDIIRGRETLKSNTFSSTRYFGNVLLSDPLAKYNRYTTKTLGLWLQSLMEINANGSVSFNFIMLLDVGEAGRGPIFLTAYHSDRDYG